MSEKSEGIKSILSLTFICLLISSSVVLAHKFTKPYIERNVNEAAYSALDGIFPNEKHYSEIEIQSEILEQYGCSFLRRADTTEALALQIETKGYQNGLVVLVGVSNSGDIIGIKVVKHSETEGIGTRAMTQEYLSKYIDNDTDKVEIISGATYTSNGIKKAVNKALELFGVIKGELRG